MLSTASSRPVILASQSPIRRAMLSAAGVEHEVEPAGIDEAAIKQAEPDPSRAVAHLARAKALTISDRHDDRWVIGSDSMVVVNGRIFDKPRDRDEAAAHLRLFSGREMRLRSAVALARNGRVEWATTDTATLVVRELGDGFIEHYLDHEWPEVAHCVGVFRLEGRGVQLFERIEGDHFTVLGLPLLPLLGALRLHGLLPS